MFILQAVILDAQSGLATGGYTTATRHNNLPTGKAGPPRCGGKSGRGSCGGTSLDDANSCNAKKCGLT